MADSHRGGGGGGGRAAKPAWDIVFPLGLKVGLRLWQPLWAGGPGPVPSATHVSPACPASSVIPISVALATPQGSLRGVHSGQHPKQPFSESHGPLLQDPATGESCLRCPDPSHRALRQSLDSHDRWPLPGCADLVGKGTLLSLFRGRGLVAGMVSFGKRCSQIYKL